jgi:hypothetical protein
MADILRIKRRLSGSPGAPSSLANAEMAYNEVDHILYYGEGTGGAGGTATTVIGIAGQGMLSGSLPLINGTASAGSGTTWSRYDHVHPTDITRAPMASPAFTGLPQATTPTFPDNSLRIPTTAYLTANYAPLVSPTFVGSVTIPSGAVITGYAPINNATFTGTHAVPAGATGTTAASGTNSTALATTAFAMSVSQNQQAVPTAAVSWNNQLLQNLAEPLSTSDAATKNYVDQHAQGLVSKGAVVTATTVNITLSGLQTVDGVLLNANDRVLVKNQTDATTNGLYTAASTAWTRTTDMDTWAEVPNAYVFVSGGTVNANSSWTCTSGAGGSIGATAITWVQFSQAAQALAGNGLNKVGNTFNVLGTANRIVVGTAVDIDAAYVGQTSITTVGTIVTGTWHGTVLGAQWGGTGAATLTGYIKGTGTTPFTASATIPTTDITGLGTMAAQNAATVAITGGTIDGVTFDMGTF